jgi:Fe-S cluster assembly iron-binding protein IscA
MLTVTDDARAHFATLLDQAEVPDGSVVRIVTKDQGLALVPDVTRDGDKEFEHDGKTVLVIQQELTSHLEGMTLDVNGDGALQIA